MGSCSPYIFIGLNDLAPNNIIYINDDSSVYIVQHIMQTVSNLLCFMMVRWTPI